MLCQYEIDSPLFSSFVSFGLGEYHLNSKHILNYCQNTENVDLIYTLGKPISSNSDISYFHDIMGAVSALLDKYPNLKVLIRFHPHQDCFFASQILSSYVRIPDHTHIDFNCFQIKSGFNFSVGSKSDTLPLSASVTIFDSPFSTFFWVAHHFLSSKCILHITNNSLLVPATENYLKLYHNITFSPISLLNALKLYI